MTWGLLLLASVFECTWAVSMKFADGFRNVRWTVVMLLAMVASMVLLAMAVRDLPIGTAYAVWTGLGAVGVAAFGMVCLGESKSPARLICLALIVLGVMGLHLSS